MDDRVIVINARSHIYAIIWIYLVLLFGHEAVRYGLHARSITTVGHEFLALHPLIVLQSLLVLRVIVCHVDFVLRFSSALWVNFR